MSKARRIISIILAGFLLLTAPMSAWAQILPPASSTPEAEEEAAVDEGKPRVVVERCEVEGGGITADAVCKVTVSLRNTSTSFHVTSVLVTGRWSSDSPPPMDFEETNQVYVNTIAPTQTRDVVFSIKTQSANIAALDAVPLYLTIDYSYEGSHSNTNAVTLRIPTVPDTPGQPRTVEIQAVPDPGPQPFAGIPLRLLSAAACAVCALTAAIMIALRLRRR